MTFKEKIIKQKTVKGHTLTLYKINKDLEIDNHTPQWAKGNHFVIEDKSLVKDKTNNKYVSNSLLEVTKTEKEGKEAFEEWGKIYSK